MQKLAFFFALPAAIVFFGAAATSCSASADIFGAGSGGAGGSGGDGATTSATTSGTGGAAATTSSGTGGQGPCVSAADCAGSSDACHIGTCINGVCEGAPANEGSACDDGKVCTQDDHCEAGLCTGSPKFCSAADSCHLGVCDTDTDTCEQVPANEGASCVDSDPCTLAGTCQAGACIATQVTDCSFLNSPCGVGTCDSQVGCIATPLNDGAACNDAQFCTVNDVCTNGVCAGAPNPCTDPQASTCMVGACDEAQDKCTAVAGNDGGACDDGNACTMSEKCQAGACVGGVPANGGTTCDDHDACTFAETCVGNGVCGGGGTISACVNGDGCCPVGCAVAGDDDCGCDPAAAVCDCFDDWLVGTPCNGIDYGNGCVPADTGYHFKGFFDGYACFWHHKNQAWNTTPASNFWHLEEHFGVSLGVGKCQWCSDKNSVPTPAGYDSCSFYFDQNNVGAWGWCAEGDPNSVGFVCIPIEGKLACP